MRPPHDHRPGARGGRRRPRAPRPRGRVLALGGLSRAPRRLGRALALRGLSGAPRRLGRAVGLGGLSLGLAATGALAAPSATVNLRDARGDVVRSPVDLQRASLGLGSDGRLNASFTMAAAWTTAGLRARSGPPGSVCVLLWTAPEADPRSEPPDRLACATAPARGDDLRATILRERAGAAPERVGPAEASRPSARSLRLRIAQSRLGAPSRVRVAFETTRPGCERSGCVDRTPEGTRTRIFRLR